MKGPFFTLRETDILLAEATMSKLFCFPSEKGSTLKEKNLLPMGSKFFPIRVDLFSEGTYEQESILFVLRFYGPVNLLGSCRARPVYLTAHLLGRLGPLSCYPVLRTFFCQK